MKRTNIAVSEILGTMLLLVIAVSSFNVLYYFVLSAPTPTPAPIVEISGTMDENQIILMHRGGEALGLDTVVFVTIGGSKQSFTVGDFLDNESKEDGVWGLGERMVYPPGEDVWGLQVEVSVVDVESNSIVLSGILHGGHRGGIWHFDAGSGSIAYDSSRNRNHGTIIGANWITGVDGTALSFNGLYVEVPNSPSLDITGNITVEAWMKPREFIGNIIIENMAHDISVGYEPNIIHVSDDICAIAYRGLDDDGFVKTIEITSNGEITNITLDELEFDTSDGYEPNIIHVSDDIYAIAYIPKTSLEGKILTVEIASNGQITDTVIDELMFESIKCYELDIIHVIGDIYAVAYRGSPSHIGYTKIIDIATNGQIADSVIDEFLFDDHISYEPDIIHISGGTFAIVFRASPSHKGFIATIRIPANPIYSGGINKMKSFGISASTTTAFGIINDQMISGAISPGWIYIVLTYDKLNIRLYSNGTEIASMPYTSAVNTSTNNLLFGYLFFGIIDEVAIYDRALSPTEVLNHYNALK